MSLNNPSLTTIQDEGVDEGAINSFNFTGSGVSITVVDNVAEIIIAGGAGGGLTLTPFTQDLGVARRSGKFDITGLSGLTVDKLVLVIQTAAPIASKGNARDEFEMDNIELTGYVLSTTSIRVYWNCQNVVVGIYAFAFAVSG